MEYDIVPISVFCQAYNISKEKQERCGLLNKSARQISKDDFDKIKEIFCKSQDLMKSLETRKRTFQNEDMF